MGHGKAMGLFNGYPLAAANLLIEPKLSLPHKEDQAPTNIPPMQRIVAQPPTKRP
jgi:hypothetical protein